MAIYNIVIIFLGIIFPFMGCAVGSDSAVSREPLVYFPTGVVGGDTIAGFASLDNGFLASDSSTSFTYSSIFPINTSAAFNGSTCYLQTDLFFTSGCEIVSSGTIVAQGNTLTFIPRSSALIFPTITSTFNRFASLTTSNTINSITWSGQYLTTSYPNGLVLYTNTGSNFVLSGTIAISGAVNAARYLKRYPGYVVAAGFRLEVYQQQVGGYIFRAGGATVNAVAVAVRPVTFYAYDQIAISRASASNISLYNFFPNTLSPDPTTPTISLPYPPVFGALSWDYNGTFLAVGTTNEVRILTWDTVFNLLPVSVPGNILSLDWSPSGAMLAVGFSAGPESLRIYSFNRSTITPTLTELTSYRISETRSVSSVAWSPDGKHIAYGRYQPGQIGNELRVYYVDYAKQRLFLNCQDSVSPTVTTTTNAVAWSVDGNYLATGNNLQQLRGYALTKLSPLYFTDLDLVLRCSAQLNAPLRFKGSSSLDMRNNELNLSNNSIIVEPGSDLRISNAKITNVSGACIQCVDNTSTLSLNHVTFVCSSTVNFNSGNIAVVSDSLVTGTFPFVYQSTGTITITSGATLAFDYGMTFSYVPTNNSPSLIAMQDRFARLYFYQNNIHVGSGGLQLTKGTLILEGPCPKIGPGALLLGDGTNANNNVRLTTLAESGFLINSGSVVYNNV